MHIGNLAVYSAFIFDSVLLPLLSLLLLLLLLSLSLFGCFQLLIVVVGINQSITYSLLHNLIFFSVLFFFSLIFCEDGDFVWYSRELKADLDNGKRGSVLGLVILVLISLSHYYNINSMCGACFC